MILCKLKFRAHMISILVSLASRLLVQGAEARAPGRKKLIFEHNHPFFFLRRPRPDIKFCCDLGWVGEENLFRYGLLGSVRNRSIPRPPSGLRNFRLLNSCRLHGQNDLCRIHSGGKLLISGRLHGQNEFLPPSRTE